MNEKARSISILETNELDLNTIDERFMGTKKFKRASPRSRKKYMKFINKNKQRDLDMVTAKYLKTLRSKQRNKSEILVK